MRHDFGLAITRGTLLIALIVAILTNTSYPSPQSPSLDEIYGIWRKRQDFVHSVRINWTEARTIPRGRGAAPDGRPVPAEDTTSDIKLALYLDGSMMRYSWEGNAWNAIENEFIPNSFWTASDGKSSKDFFEVLKNSPLSDHPFPTGFINAGSYSPDAINGNYHLEMPLFVFRPLHPVFGCVGDLINHKASGTIDLTVRTLGQSECVVIGQWFDQYRREIWIEYNKDCSIRRYLVSKRDGKPFYQIDCDFTHDVSSGWLPSRWRIDSWLPGRNGSRKLSESDSSTVTAIDVNPTISISEFRPTFPPETLVADRHDGTEQLIRSDGTIRPILAEERKRGANYDDYANSEPGEAGLRSGGLRAGFLIGMGLFLTLAIAAALWHFRRLRSFASPRS